MFLRTSTAVTGLAVALSAGVIAQTAVPALAASPTRYTIMTEQAPRKAVATVGTGTSLVKRDMKQANQRWSKTAVNGGFVFRSDTGFCMVDDGAGTIGGTLKLESCSSGETGARYRWNAEKLSGQFGPNRYTNAKTGRILVRGSDRVLLDRAGAPKSTDQGFHVITPPKIKRPGA